MSQHTLDEGENNNPGDDFDLSEKIVVERPSKSANRAGRKSFAKTIPTTPQNMKGTSLNDQFLSISNSKGG